MNICECKNRNNLRGYRWVPFNVFCTLYSVHYSLLAMDLIFKQSELKYLDDVMPEAFKKEREAEENRQLELLRQMEQSQKQQLAGSIQFNLPDGQEVHVDIETQAHAKGGDVVTATGGDHQNSRRPQVQITDELVPIEDDDPFDTGEDHNALIGPIGSTKQSYSQEAKSTSTPRNTSCRAGATGVNSIGSADRCGGPSADMVLSVPVSCTVTFRSPSKSTEKTQQEPLQELFKTLTPTPNDINGAPTASTSRNNAESYTDVSASLQMSSLSNASASAAGASDSSNGELSLISAV